MMPGLIHEDVRAYFVAHRASRSHHPVGSTLTSLRRRSLSLPGERERSRRRHRLPISSTGGTSGVALQLPAGPAADFGQRQNDRLNYCGAPCDAEWSNAG